MLYGIGGSVRLSKAPGGTPPEKADTYYTVSLLPALIATAAVWLPAVLFRREAFTLFGASQSALILAYGDWSFWTFPAFILFACMIRCHSVPNCIKAFVAAGGIFNVFGDWFLIFPMDMGTAGAAITLISFKRTRRLIAAEKRLLEEPL